MSSEPPQPSPRSLFLARWPKRLPADQKCHSISRGRKRQDFAAFDDPVRPSFWAPSVNGKIITQLLCWCDLAAYARKLFLLALAGSRFERKLVRFWTPKTANPETAIYADHSDAGIGERRHPKVSDSRKKSRGEYRLVAAAEWGTVPRSQPGGFTAHGL
jgi:hypothetical protein